LRVELRLLVSEVVVVPPLKLVFALVVMVV